MNNILLIGSLKLFWFRKYVDNVALALFAPANVWLLTDTADDALVEAYEAKGVHVITAPSGAGKIGFVLHLLRTAAEVRKKAHFDIIHAQYVSIKNLMLARLIKQKNTKLVATFWGSDIAIRDARTVKRQDSLLNGFDKITTTAMRTGIVAKSKLSPKNGAKISSIGLGADSLRMIHALKQANTDRKKLREALGIPTDLVTVAVGYNARPMQQHLQVVDAMAVLSAEIKEKLLVILPMTYLREGNEAYIERVKNACDAGGLRYIEFDKFMVDPENSYLRMSADIYINAQESDALSGSVCEFVYSGAALINAEWLHYPEFDDFGLNYSSFSDYSEIPGLITDFFDGRLARNSEAILQKMYADSGWDVCANKYRRIYEID